MKFTLLRNKSTSTKTNESYLFFDYEFYKNTYSDLSEHGILTKEKCLAADIIVTGVGKKDTLRGDMVKKDAIVIDTGVDFENGKMYGDVNVLEIDEKGARVTPTPGGIGPITVARLLYNTVICAKNAQ